MITCFDWFERYSGFVKAKLIVNPKEEVQER